MLLKILLESAFAFDDINHDLVNSGTWLQREWHKYTEKSSKYHIAIVESIQSISENPI